MSTGLLRGAWPSIRCGVALGCGAALAGALAYSLLVFGSSTASRLMEGDLLMRHFLSADASPYAWSSFLLGGVALCFLAAALPGSLGGGAIALALHILAPRVGSLTRLGAVIGCLVGGLAGTIAVLSVHLLLYPVPAIGVAVLFRGFPYAEMALLAIGIAALAGTGVGKWLASRETIVST